MIFSDGIETDYLEFNSGGIARIGVAEKKVYLVVPNNYTLQPSETARRSIAAGCHQWYPRRASQALTERHENSAFRPHALRDLCQAPCL